MTSDQVELLQWVESLQSPERYTHTVRVLDAAVELARRFGADEEAAAKAAILHDCARDLSLDTQLKLVNTFDIVVPDIHRLAGGLLHAPVGAELAKRECNVDDEQVLSAIRLHTTGGAGMSLLDKVLFTADYTEPGRDFPGVNEVRRAAQRDLDEAMLLAIDQTIVYVVQRGQLLHPGAVEARNELLFDRESERTARSQ